ncbi:MAG TPA: chloride channel protein [Anaeromyxobacteraceae bacterium]|nr:chloride channel protein [Anaeromyxobacteraceae bacterium]
MGRHMVFVAAPVGALVGLAIAAYDWAVNDLLWRRITAHSVGLQVVAPFFGLLLTGLLLRLFRTPSTAMADEVVRSYHEPGEGMPTGTAPGKLAASLATLGLGGSAGMEGASKWLGATIGSFVQTALNRLGLPAVAGRTKTTLLVGGSAGIAAIFRAPLSGAIMGVESPYKHDLAHEALLPALVASATSFWTFSRLRSTAPLFPVTFTYALDGRDLLVAVLLGLACGVASHLFLWTLARLRAGFAALTGSVVLRAAAGGVALVLIALAARALVGAPVTLGAGLPVSNALLAGQYALWAALAVFVLKLLATAVTFGCGGVGGLFVPSAAMGAAVGAAFDAVLAPSHPGVFTLLGIAAFTGASYNGILFSAVFVAEATGNVFLVVPSLVASAVAFAVSAGVSNSRSQRRRRAGWRDRLRAVPVAEVMTTRLVTTVPEQTLEGFSRSVLLEHHFKALPVVDGGGALLGMVGLPQLRDVPMAEWATVRVADVLDAAAPRVGAHQAVGDAAEALRSGPYGYVPVVEAATSRLVGIVSDSDVYRALGEPSGEAS